MTDLFARIDAALDRGDMGEAAALAQRAFDAGGRTALLYNLLAWQQEEAGRFAESEALLRDAIARYPGDPQLQLGLGVTLRHQGKLKDAVEAFEAAICRDPRYAPAWMERGATFERGGALADAAEDYRRVLAIDPRDAGAHAALAGILARQGAHDAARGHAERALALEPGNIAGRAALAQAAIEARDFATVVELLEPVAGDDGDRREALIGVRTLLGDGYQGLGRFDDAHRSFASAQALFAAIHTPRIEPGRPSPIERLATTERAFAAIDKATWCPPAPAIPAAQHVVLTGFPRSGTTLVENILASLPNAVAIEERPTLAETEQRYLPEEDGLARLAAADDAALDALRADYWTRAERAAGTPLAGKLFVDMDPFKGSRLPLVARLFPAAKLVVMRRDPRDVVWSCFRTNFAFNAATIGFTTLEDTARCYDLSWRIAEAALAELPLDAFTLRYDALVRDFDATTQALCGFLGIAWDEKLRDFASTAQRRGVSTASATQVRRGLYDGSGGWRRYEKQLRSVATILDPWIERFGYDPW